MPPALADEIRALLAHGAPKHVAYKVLIADQLPDAAEPKRWAYGPSPVRLYRKDAGRYSTAPCTTASSWSRAAPSVACASASTIAHRARWRTSWPRSTPTPTSRSPTWWRAARAIGQWRLLVEMPLWFFKYYVMRRQFIHGFYGFTTSVGAAFGRFLRVAKLIEAQREQARKQRKP